MKNTRNTIKRYTFLFLGIWVLLGVSCNEEKSDNSAQSDAKSLSKKVHLSKDSQPALSTKAKNIASEWYSYNSAQMEIEKIPGSSLRQIIDNKENLLKSITALNDSLPQPFKTTPIESRLKVLSTKAQIFNQNAGRQEIDSKQLEQEIGQVYHAFQNLKIQLNEVFYTLPDFNAIDIDAEQDSIQERHKEQLKSSAKRNTIETPKKNN